MLLPLLSALASSTASGRHRPPARPPRKEELLRRACCMLHAARRRSRAPLLLAAATFAQGAGRHRRLAPPPPPLTRSSSSAYVSPPPLDCLVREAARDAEEAEEPDVLETAQQRGRAEERGDFTSGVFPRSQIRNTWRGTGAGAGAGETCARLRVGGARTLPSSGRSGRRSGSPWRKPGGPRYR